MNRGFDRLSWIKQLEYTAVAAVAIALACVLIGQGAERYAATASPSEVALVDPSAGEARAGTHGIPIFNTIDYATTGAIKGQTVVISPCGSQKVER